MKIVLLNWQDPENPQAGGAERHLQEVFRRLVERGHRVDWLVSGWADAPKTANIDGMWISRSAGRYSFGFSAPGSFRKNRTLREADIVVEALNKVPLYTPLWTRKPLVLLVHHLFGRTAFQQASIPLAAATWLQERPVPAVYRKTPIETISRSTADDLIRRGIRPERIEVIHPGVDSSFFCPSSSPTRAIPPTFLYIGRLERYKSVDQILRAFAEVRKSVPGARLVVAGRGDEESRLKTLATTLNVSDGVHFPGFVNEETKRNLLRTAWAHVFCSPKEGWGMTNMEAAACGTATIASNSPGLRESVRDQETGLLVPYGNIEALSRAMLQIATNPALVEQLGGAALDFAQGFSWDAAADRTEAHLLSVLQQTPPEDTAEQAVPSSPTGSNQAQGSS